MRKVYWMQGSAWALVTVLLGGCVHQAPVSQTADANGHPPRVLSMGSSDADKWLQVQREGSQASSTPQRLSDAERELAHQRWLDSFSHPIPEFYERDAGGGFSED